MGVSLSALIGNIGVSVQKANAIIEQTAVAVYLEQGYDYNQNGENAQDEYVPIQYALHMQTASGKKKLQVPVTALMHHSSLKLEQVDVRLKFVVEENLEDDLIVSVKSSSDRMENLSMSELSMQFKNQVQAEGVARINNYHVQTL